MPSGPEISVVVPVYDEEDNLPILHQELATALSGSGRSWECVYVDDGSRDRSLAVLLRLRAQDPRRIRIVQFARKIDKIKPFVNRHCRSKCIQNIVSVKWMLRQINCCIFREH